MCVCVCVCVCGVCIYRPLSHEQEETQVQF